MSIDYRKNNYHWVMDDSALTFGQLIARARNHKGWTQDDLARNSGISRPTISRWERDAMTGTAEPETVRALCVALDIDPRQAAVSLGYLTVEEIQPTKPLPAQMQKVLEVLQDPRISDATKKEWIDYLMYLRTKTQSPTNAG
jgi:transcriptional regulator with XRE-family HTH domain